MNNLRNGESSYFTCCFKEKYRNHLFEIQEYLLPAVIRDNE